MKKFRIIALILIVVLIVGAFAACGNSKELEERIAELEAALEAEKNNPHPEQFTKWLLNEENTVWHAITAGNFSDKPEDRMPREMMEECLQFAYQAQFAGNAQHVFFVVLDTDAAIDWLKTQKIDNSWKNIVDNLKRGVSVVFVFGYIGSGGYQNWTNFDAGQASGMLSAALFSKGWSTHWYCDTNWYDLGSPASTPDKDPDRSANKTITELLVKQGFEFRNVSMAGVVAAPKPTTTVTDWRFLHAAFIGKPSEEALAKAAAAAADEEHAQHNNPVATYATPGARGNNWGFWLPGKN